MSKKDEILTAEQGILSVPMEEVMHMSMIPYAEHVIMDRAVPRVEDGLKPVQRRILFTMNELGITPDTPYRKCTFHELDNIVEYLVFGIVISQMGYLSVQVP